MEAKIISFYYETGEYAVTQGHKGYEKKHNKSGKYINPKGFGWATEYKPSRITLGIVVNGVYAEVWVDRFFKDNWGRLTAGRVNAIKNTLPKEVNVIENIGLSGEIYYTIDDESLEKWLAAANKIK
ncbi:MAG TPA: hypothetical protein VIO64_01615 [Pseudobacteroides sp.]|uniref:hypothetical protein n=1 Tax=Pseudobacteroides sp. TaxID=1968840 RepID=UPI002F955B02